MSTPSTVTGTGQLPLLAAQTAAANPTTIAYIGDFNSGASAVSIPILNRSRSRRSARTAAPWG